ncbi:hypothetical protein C6497_12305 [Candidatus Poribacteria bacterium]|nr:MAG: hypothetical protein C6497_12305 [Candidatus Poribacteria bacterium]
MHYIILVCALLVFGILLCLIKNRHIKIDESDIKSSDFISEQSEQFQANDSDLYRKLTNANSEILQLTQTLNEIAHENSQLVSELNEAKLRNKQLRGDLFNVVQSNESAIHALHLTTLSLQMCGLILQRELNRSERLLVNYESLKNRLQTICVEIESKARRRLFKKGIGVPYRFTPGVEQIQLLRDFSEIIDLTTKIIEGNYADVDKTHSNVGLSEDIQIDDVDLLSSRLKISGIQGIINEAIKQNNNPQSQHQDDTTLRDFVINTLMYTKTLTDSWSDVEYHQGIAAIVSNLNKLDYHIFIPDHTCESMNIKRGIQVPACYQNEIHENVGFEKSKSY